MRPVNSHDSATLPVRVARSSYDLLKEMAADRGVSLTACLDAIVSEAYRRGVWAEYRSTGRMVAEDRGLAAAYRAEDTLWEGPAGDPGDEADDVSLDDAPEDAATW